MQSKRSKVVSLLGLSSSLWAWANLGCGADDSTKGKEPTTECALAEDSSAFCNEKLGEGFWACAVDCPDVDIDPSGCVLVSELTTAGIKVDDACIELWPETDTGDTDTMSGSGGKDMSGATDSDGSSSSGDDSTHSETSSDMTAECATDADCVGAEGGPACDTDLGVCVPCVDSETHCLDETKPVCGEHEELRSCEQCFSDSDCSVWEGMTRCQAHELDGEYEPRCVECLQDEDCADVEGAPRCYLPEDDAAPNCVECLEDADCTDPARPICDLENVDAPGCRACAQIEGECADDAACWFWDDEPGECAERVLYVDGSAMNCETADGSASKPLCTLSAAMALVEDEVHTTIRVVGKLELEDRLEVGAEKIVTVIGDSKLSKIDAGGSTVLVQDGGALSLYGLEVTGEVLHAITCRGAGSRIRLTNVQLSGATDSGLDSDSCQIIGERVEIVGNGGFGMSLSGGALRFQTSVIGGNGNINDSSAGGLYLENGAEIQLRHSTVVSNSNKDSGSLINCRFGDATVTVQDSILISQQPDGFAECLPESIVANRNVSDIPELVGDGGAMFMGTALNRIFSGPALNKFRLKNGLEDVTDDPDIEAIRSTGLWEAGGPVIDLDGDPWIEGMGYVGADQSN